MNDSLFGDRLTVDIGLTDRDLLSWLASRLLDPVAARLFGGRWIWTIEWHFGHAAIVSTIDGSVTRNRLPQVGHCTAKGANDNRLLFGDKVGRSGFRPSAFDKDK